MLCFLLPLWYNPGKVVINMDTKEILLELRTKHGSPRSSWRSRCM